MKKTKKINRSNDKVDINDGIAIEKDNGSTYDSNQHPLIERGESYYLKRTKLKDAMNDLGIKDKRTFKKWCISNGVEVIHDIGGSFVYEDEFYFKANAKIFDLMRKKYGDNWQDNNFNGEENTGGSPEKSIIKDGYKPVSKAAASLMKKKYSQTENEYLNVT